MKELYKWYSVLLPKLVPMLYKNGGPVISVQVENEYGGYGCDFEYTTLLRDFLRKYLGNDVILFTTDNNNDNSLKCGKIDDVFATVDFGTDSEPSDAFAIQRRHQEFGPYVNSEFYPGWLDYWEEPHSQTSIDAVCNTLDKTLALNASINV
jgi:beta-galactosidase